MDDFQTQFDKAIEAYSTQNQYGVSKVPYHTHNNTDSPKIDISNISRFPSNPTNGQTISFDSTTNQWVATSSSSVTYKNGVATRAGNTASGTQTIAHGLGKTPQKTKITVLTKWNTGDTSAESYGVYNGTTTSCVYLARDAAAGNPIAGNTSTYVAYQYNSATGTTLQTATITVDATNINLAWVLTGAGNNAANMNILWEVE